MQKKLKQILLYAIVITLVTITFSACITTKDINYLQKPSLKIPKYNDSIGYKEYVLAPYDRVYIRLYSADEDKNLIINGTNQGQLIQGANTELYTYTIKDDGTIKIPFVGEVKIGGLYIRDAKKAVEKALKRIMIDKCAIDIQVVDRYFSILGGGINGKYNIYKEKMNIFQAIAMAGDISILGDRSKIRILRETPDGKEIKTFDIRSRDIINSEYYYIQPNDVIYIQEIGSQFFSVTNVGSAFSTFFTTVSFGMLMYNLIKPKKATTDIEL